MNPHIQLSQFFLTVLTHKSWYEKSEQF